jgi:hypothetical protein
MRPDLAAHARPSTASRFFRNPDTGELVVAQWPNAPLWVFLAATAVRLLLKPDGVLGTAVSVIGTLSLLVWSVLEVARGDSPFRRVLGGLVLIGTVLGLLLR